MTEPAGEAEDRSSWGLAREMERATADVAVAREGDSTIVSLSGELDIASASRLHEALRDALADSSRVVVDVSAVTFMDSTALRVLLTLTRDTQSDDEPRLVLRNPSAPVARLLEVTGLGDVLRVDG